MLEPLVVASHHEVGQPILIGWNDRASELVVKVGAVLKSHPGAQNLVLVEKRGLLRKESLGSGILPWAILCRSSEYAVV